MGILNATPDSFSGDGLLARAATNGPAPSAPATALELARAMIEAGADVVDVGGESTRPGHVDVAADEECDRVVPVVAALRAALPDIVISIDTTKASVAEAAIGAGADLVNDVWGIRAEPALLDLVAAHGVPLIVMHNRERPVYADLVGEVLADLADGLDRAAAAGIPRDRLIVDPGIGFGKTAEQNLALLHDLGALRGLGRPILLGTSRKSTLGRVLDLPPDERLEATIATTALGIGAGVDIVRVHDVRPNVRAARIADAIVRRPANGPTPADTGP
jgi:dihydropteroate synthase